MNIEHLKLFTRLAYTHNISKAGQELNLSAPLASLHLKQLEQNVGARLFHRTTRKVSLTEEGVAFLPFAEEVLLSVDAAYESVGTGKTQPQGTLKITAPASFGCMHLIPALKGFLAKYPRLSVDIQLTDSIIDLIEGGFDVAIRNAELKDSSLIARKLATDKRILCASPEYIDQYSEPKTPSDLNNHSCIKQTGIASWTFKTSGGLVKVNANSNIQVDHGEAVRDACANGIGIAMCATWIAYKHLKQGKLIQVLKNYPLVDESAIWAIYPSSRQLAPKVRAFIEYALEYYASPVYWRI